MHLAPCFLPYFADLRHKHGLFVLRAPFIALLLCTFSLGAQSDNSPLRIAVAANFYLPMQALVGAFHQEHDTRIELSTGSTGTLYGQIVHGAPFDVFFAADQQRPQALIEQQRAEASSRFTYAQGQLVLWSPKANEKDLENKLKSLNFNKLALADARVAPFGLAAENTLKALNLFEQSQHKHVYSKSLSQAYHYVSSGAVDLGFVALSQVLARNEYERGTLWHVPQALYAPLKHDAVILNRSQQQALARRFMAFLQGDAAQQIMLQFGYGAQHE